MRRALILGVIVLGVAAWFILRPSNETWVVVFAVEDSGLRFDDPCTPSPLINGGFATGPSEYGGLWEVDDRADGEDLVSCYQANGGSADVHEATSGEKDRLEEERRFQDEG